MNNDNKYIIKSGHYKYYATTKKEAIKVAHELLMSAACENVASWRVLVYNLKTKKVVYGLDYTCSMNGYDIPINYGNRLGNISIIRNEILDEYNCSFLTR